MEQKRQLQFAAAEGTSQGVPRATPPATRTTQLLAALRKIHWVVLALTPVIWTHFFPVAPASELNRPAIWAALGTAATALVSLAYVRRLQVAPIEMGWMVFTWSMLVNVLDSMSIQLGSAQSVVNAAEGVLAAAGIGCIAAALSQLRKSQQRDLQSLESSHENYQGLINTLDAVAWEADPDTLRFTYVSRRAEGLLGFPIETWLERPNFWEERVHEQDRDWTLEYRKAHARRREGHQLEYRMTAVDGRTLWIRDSVRVIFQQGGQVMLRGVFTDITARKLLETQLHHNATHDPLTGLPNRAAFLDRLEQAKREASPGSDPYALLFLDLDRFKLVNDSLGHLAGDELLVTISSRLSRCVRGEDLVARLGGDEFGVFLASIPSEETAVQLAERLLETVNRPAAIGDSRVTPSASVGIVVGGPDRSDPTSLLRDADTAMYRAKEAARGSFEVFEPGMRKQIVRRVRMESDLQQALEQDEFELQLQPVVELDSGTLDSFEGLLRWRREDGSVALPHEFMGYAEDSGLMRVIGWKAMEKACSIRRSWDEAGLPPTPIAVNLSESQFAQRDLADELEKMLEQHEVSASELYLEITETVMAEADASVMEKLARLKQMGFRLAMDDFGTGKSTLSRLCTFPMDVIKIDRGFVQRLGDGGPEESLIRAVLALASDLGIEVVAEGIETIEQLTRLQSLGCRYGQGFLFSKAIPVDRARDLLDGRPFDAYGSREQAAIRL